MSDDKILGSRIQFNLLVVLLLFVSVLISYGHTLNYSFHLDDQIGIIQNENIHLANWSWEKFRQIFKSNRPVSNLTFALNYYFGGLSVKGYHLFNIGVHFLNALLVYSLFLKTLELSENRGQVLKTSQPKHQIALLAAVLWAVHPIHTQAVTYIIQRMASLAALFYLAALHCYISGRQNRRGKPFFYFFLFGLFSIAAFGTKENTLMLPVVVLLYDLFFISKFHVDFSWKKLLTVGAVTAVLGLGLIWTILKYQGTIFRANYLFSSQYGAGDLDPILRTMTEWRVLVLYLSLLLFPFPGRMNLDYDISISNSLFDPITTLLCLSIILSLLIFAGWKAKTYPILSFAIIWFFLNLGIESTIIKLDLIYEHRCYLPSVLFFLAISMALFSLGNIFEGRIRPITPFIVVTLVGILIAMTWARNKVWESEISLWSDVVSKSPLKERDIAYLGAVYLGNGNPEMAIESFQSAIKLNSKDPIVHYDLGNAYQALKNYPAAVEELNQAIYLKSDYPEAHFNLGNLYVFLNQNDLAISEFKKFVELKYNMNFYNAQAHTYLGILFLRTGNLLEAQKEFEEGIILNPKTSFGQYHYAIFLETMGKRDEAVRHYQEALNWADEYGSITPDMIRQKLYHLK